MRFLAMFLTVCALVAVGCGGDDSSRTATPIPESPSEPDGGAVAASCVAGFTWNGRFYARDAGQLERPVELGSELGPGVEPGCNDTGQDVEPDREVTVLRIKGVDPEIAVARQGDDHPYFNVRSAP